LHLNLAVGGDALNAFTHSEYGSPLDVGRAGGKHAIAGVSLVGTVVGVSTGPTLMSGA